MNKMILQTEGDLYIGVTRRFNAPPEAEKTPDNHVVTSFQADGTGTLMTMRMTLPNPETRAAMLATGMEHGMEASCARLERDSGWEGVQ